jgi:4-hydroxybenzoate polyprenyltransferase
MLSSKIKALLATARIANVPSVVSNVFTGMLLVTGDDRVPGWNTPTIPVTFAAVFLYIAGNFLNDWHDVAWDEKNRPERAIPSGLFSRGLYLFIASSLLLLGLSLSVYVSKTTAIVFLSIAILVYFYTVLHKKKSYSIWIMGACRAGLYLLGFATMLALSRNKVSSERWDFMAITALIIALPMLGLLAYIAGISLLARYETRSSDLSHQSNSFAAMLLLLPALTHSCLLSLLAGSFGNYGQILLCVVAMMPFVIWTSLTVFRKYSVSTKVSRLLAGIPLVDSVCLISLFFVMGLHPIYSIVLPIACFLAAMLLQKIAPAT